MHDETMGEITTQSNEQSIPETVEPDVLTSDNETASPAESFGSAAEPDSADTASEASTEASEGGSETDISYRLADEFDELCREMPEIANFEQIPTEVVMHAAESGLHLLDALLRFQHSERRRAEMARQTAADNAARSTGALFDAPYEPHPEMDAFSRSFLASIG